MFIQRRRSAAAVQRSTEMAAQSRSDRRTTPRGLSFAQAEAALAPEAPVQRKQDRGGRVLERGAKGPAVAALQRRLATFLGVDLTADGIFGRATASAVKSAQRRLGVDATGKWDLASAQALDQHAENGSSGPDPGDAERDRGGGSTRLFGRPIASRALAEMGALGATVGQELPLIEE